MLGSVPHRRVRRSGALAALGLLTAAAALVPVSPANAQSGVFVRATPGLTPAFNANVTDYATRCTSGPSVRLRVIAPAASPVSVDGQPAKSGLFYATVPLQANQRFSFTVGTKQYNVRCLPEDFPAYSATRTGTPQAAYYLVTPTPPDYAIMYDNNGVPVWWKKTPEGTGVGDFKWLPDGTLAWHVLNPQLFVGYSTLNADHWEVHRFDGSLVRELRYAGSPTDLHDMQLLPNGNYLVTSFTRRDGVDLRSLGVTYVKSVMDAGVQEITPAGQVVWQWHSEDHTALDEVGRWEGPLRVRPMPDGKLVFDARHLNSVEPDGANGLIMSMRHTDSLYRIDRATGNVTWKLGGTQTPQSLRIIGDPQGNAAFGGQHDARVLPDGTITLYDNGTGRSRPPRAMRFRLDLTARTATLLESVQDSGSRISNAVGSARKLPGGNWVVGWGGTPLVSETTATGTPVLKLKGDGGYTYRANPVLPGQIDPAALRAGMDSMYPR